jgi:hypothetical protein
MANHLSGAGAISLRPIVVEAAIGVRFGETYRVLPSVADPDSIADNSRAR